MYRIILSLFIALTLTAPAWSQTTPVDPPPPPADEPITTPLTLHPLDEPRPALKYRLLPTPREQRPGNAAVFYNKAGLIYAENQGEFQATEDTINQWIKTRGSSAIYETPLDQLPLEEGRQTLRKWSMVLRTIEEASHREFCDWQMPVREEAPFSIILPELQVMRVYGRVLAAKVRFHLAAGELEDALATLKIGYAVARHAAAGPTLIHGLIGVVISQLSSAAAFELLQQPTAPNLYWTLSDLPQPLIDFRPAYQYEMDWIYFWHPEWADIGTKQYSEAEWRRMYDVLVSGLGEMDSKYAGENQRWLVAALAVKGYPRAKRSLIAEGRSPDDVEAMPVAQALMIYTMQTYDELRDDLFKWSALPIWQARAGIAEADERLHERAARQEVLPLAQLILPAFQAASLAQARGQRTLALLRAVEALRLYAARHDGELPDALADIREAPVPDDPVTGEAFQYHLDGERAVLEAPAPEGMSKETFAVRYVITIAK
jgi:hypothetical protein